MDTNRLITEYLEYLEHSCGFAIRTLKLHKRVCNIWDQFLSTKASLVEATPTDLIDYINSRQQTGKIKNATISRELCVIRTLYAYLFDYQKMTSNPSASLPELICEPPEEKAYLTIDECFDLLQAFNTDDLIGLRDYTIVALLWSTGLRNGELCALNWRDIDLIEGTLLVRKGKGGKQRRLFLNDRIWKDLIRYRQQIQGDENSPVFYAFSKNGSSTKKHARLSQSRVVEIIRKHGIGLKKAINPLTFRHTFATHMYEAGVSIQDIKEMLGHDDETETTIYVHISIDGAKRFLNDHIANPKMYQ
jgi:site-specific recombinase XerD